MEINAASRLLTIVGDPVEHSLSPAMHNAAIRALGLSAIYVAVRTDHAALPHVIRAFEALGVAGNVTVPHKQTVASLLIRVTGIAKELGAVNTFWPEQGRLVGDNTDVRGVLETADALETEGPWLIAGTGGAARAAAAAARDRNTPVFIRSRAPTRAQEFVDWMQEIGIRDGRVDDGTEPIGLAINATPLGLAEEDPAPLSAADVARCAAGFDMVYRPGMTPLVSLFRQHGKPAVDGRLMLVAQGAAAFERFFPDERAPRAVMRAAVDRWLNA